MNVTLCPDLAMHQACLQPWFQRHKTCPYCRDDVQTALERASGHAAAATTATQEECLPERRLVEEVDLRGLSLDTATAPGGAPTQSSGGGAADLRSRRGEDARYM